MLSETEHQLKILEDLVKDAGLDFEIQEQNKKLQILHDNKFADLERLKSEFPRAHL